MSRPAASCPAVAGDGRARPTTREPGRRQRAPGEQAGGGWSTGRAARIFAAVVGSCIAGAGCFDASVDEGASVTIACETDAGCPTGWTCIATIGECIPAAELQATPAPRIDGIAVAPQRAAPGADIVVDFAVDGALRGAPTVSCAGQTRAATATATGFRAVLDAPSTEGVHAVNVRVVGDTGDAVEEGIGDIVVDATAPTAVVFQVSDADIGAGAIEVEVVLDENVATPPSVGLRMPGLAAPAAVATAGEGSRFAATIEAATLAEGIWTLGVEGVDDAGHAIVGPSIDLRIDRTAPAVVTFTVAGGDGRRPLDEALAVRVTMSEALVAPPRLIAVSDAAPNGVPFNVDASGASAIFFLPGGVLPAARYELVLGGAEDGAGNVGAEVVLSTLVIDAKPPALSIVDAPAPVVSAKPGFNLVELTVAIVDDDPVVRVTATCGERPMTCVDDAQDAAAAAAAAETGERRVRCSLEVGDDDDEGTATISVAATDTAGNSSIRAAFVVVDRTPPAIVPGTVSVVLRDAAGAADPSPRLGIGKTALARFALTEATSQLRVTAELDQRTRRTLALRDAVQELRTFELDPSGLPDGGYAIVVDAVDVVGNRASRLPIEDIDVDQRAPVVVADRVTHERAPWGAPSSGGAPRLAVFGGAGATDPHVDVVVTDPTGFELARGVARDDGGFDLPLRVDHVAVQVYAVDDGGNVGPRVTPAESTWIAAMGDGGAVANPHTASFQRGRGRGLNTSGAVVVDDLTIDDRVVSLAVTPETRTSRGAPFDSTNAPGAPGVAYDARRGVIVAFGGSSSAIGTWEWDGVSWVERRFSNGPPARSGGQLAYDGARGVVVLFGGNNGQNDTWVYDGTWREVRPATVPPRGYGASMAYDPVRELVVLHLGDYAGPSTWGFDGVDWRQIAAGGPQQRADLAFSSRLGVLVGYGNAGTHVLDGATWRSVASFPGGLFEGLIEDPRTGLVVGVGSQFFVFTGDEWVPSSMSPPPLPTSFGSGSSSGYGGIVFDPQREQIVMFGATQWSNGYGGSAIVGEHGRWSLVDGSFVARTSSAAAFDPTSSEIVLYGGTSTSSAPCGFGGGSCSDTHAWQGHGWRYLSGGGLPGSQSGHVLFTVGGEVVLRPTTGDSFVWRARSWVPVAGSSQGFSPDLAVAFDEDDDVIVATDYNGQSVASQTFDGRSWSTEAGGPHFSFRRMMGYDGRTGEVIAFGGELFRLGALATTSVRGDGGWQSAVVEGTPPARSEGRLVRDTRRDRLILVGGLGSATQEIWAYAARRWERLPVNLPGAFRNFAAAYDEVRDEIVVATGLVDGSEFRETLVIDLGGTHAPCLLLSFDVGASGLDLERVDAVTLDIAQQTEGVSAQVWRRGFFVPLAEGLAGPATIVVDDVARAVIDGRLYVRLLAPPDAALVVDGVTLTIATSVSDDAGPL
jgi:hypothetical protein